MRDWIYYGNRTVRKSNSTLSITLPPVLFQNSVLPEHEDAGVFWYWDEEASAVALADGIPSAKELNQATKDRSEITEAGSSRSTTIIKKFRTGTKNKIPEKLKFEEDDQICFITLNGGPENDTESCYLIKEGNVEEFILNLRLWNGSSENIERLLDDEIVEVNDIPKIIEGPCSKHLLNNIFSSILEDEEEFRSTDINNFLEFKNSLSLIKEIEVSEELGIRLPQLVLATVAIDEGSENYSGHWFYDQKTEAIVIGNTESIEWCCEYVTKSKLVHLFSEYTEIPDEYSEKYDWEMPEELLCIATKEMTAGENRFIYILNRNSIINLIDNF